MARVTKKFPLGLLDVDRLAVRPKTLVFAQALMEGATFPPVRAALQRSGRLRLLDGRHRFAAHKLVGFKKIAVRYSTRTEEK